MADPKTITQLADIGSALVDTDETEVQRAGQTTTKKAAYSRIKTYILGTAGIGGTGAGDIPTNGSTGTFTNKRLTTPKINEDVALNATSTELNACRGLTAARALVSDANGRVSVSSITSTLLGYLAGLTGSVQNQLDALSVGSGVRAVIYQTTFTMSGGGSSQVKTYTEAQILTAMGLSTSNFVILAPVNVNVFDYSSSTYTEPATALRKISEQTENGQTHLEKIEITTLSDASYGISIVMQITNKATPA